MSDIIYGVTYANIDTLYFEADCCHEAEAFAAEWRTEVFEADPTCLPVDAEIFAPEPAGDWYLEQLPELTPADSVA